MLNANIASTYASLGISVEHTNTPMTNRYIFFKILDSKYVPSFLDGLLHMNALAYFSQIEGDAVRSDRHEGADEAIQVQCVEIQDENGKFIPINGLINPIVYRSGVNSGINIFCMYALPEDQKHRFDERNLQFGDAFVLLNNPEEFARRVRVAADNINRAVNFGLVEYVDQDYNGPLGAFRKFDSFSYQSEFRIGLAGGDEKPLYLEIGDIRDICHVGESARLNELFTQLKGVA